MRRTSSLSRLLLIAAVTITGLRVATDPALAGYVQTDLVSDIPGLALITDPELVNPWGVAESATSPFWVSNQGNNTSTLYTVTGVANVTKVNINAPSGFVGIPTTASGPQGPTGQVSNSNTSSFLVGNGGNGAAAHFIFANLNGTISAWDTGATSIVQATTSGAVYTGLAINTAQTMIYAANGAGSGGINVFNSSFAPAAVSGTFTDPNLPSGYVPFNIQDIGGKLYVTYAPAGRSAQTTATAGMGIVDIFDENGNFLQRLITGSQLASPWGIALAPASFAPFGGDLLVGNFSYADSVINAFNPITGAFVGSIPVNNGGNSPGGLWDLTFGNGGNGGSPGALYFTDGLNGEADGLFGVFTVPEPSTLALLGVALAWFVPRRGRSRGRA
jgi:uncharacterized protein (TIGR03118 family)